MPKACMASVSTPVRFMVSSICSFSKGSEANPKGASPMPGMESSTNWPGRKSILYPSVNFRR